MRTRDRFAHPRGRGPPSRTDAGWHHVAPRAIRAGRWRGRESIAFSVLPPYAALGLCTGFARAGTIRSAECVHAIERMAMRTGCVGSGTWGPPTPTEKM